MCFGFCGWFFFLCFFGFFGVFFVFQLKEAKLTSRESILYPLEETGQLPRAGKIACNRSQSQSTASVNNAVLAVMATLCATYCCEVLLLLSFYGVGFNEKVSFEG